jgi:hypothetical protein
MKNKLALHQETLRKLTHTQTGEKLFASKHTCVNSVCGLACTPKAGMQ